jgi:hypothetical protein
MWVWEWVWVWMWVWWVWVWVWVCMLKIFQIGISCLGNSHKHQNNIMQKKTSIKINNYLPCSIKIAYTVR